MKMDIKKLLNKEFNIFNKVLKTLIKTFTLNSAKVGK